MDDILVPDTYYQYYYNEAVYTEFDGDGQLTSAIDSVVSNASHKAYAVTNHGESDLGTEISALLTKNHFKVSDLGLLLEGAVPDDCRGADPEPAHPGPGQGRAEIHSNLPVQGGAGVPGPAR